MLRVKGLQVRYGALAPVLRGVDIEVPGGSLVCVLGTNGVGKTTLLRALSGSLPLYAGAIVAGRIEWEGKDVTKARADQLVRSGVVHSPEGRGIFGNLSVDDNLRAGAFTRKRKDLEASLAEMYEFFPDLTDRRSQRGGLLSGGQQQMLAIARALMARPKLLLLDEPSLGLAPQAVENIARIIRRINAEGTGVILVEQNAVMALELSDYAYVLEGGRAALEGPAAELKQSDDVRRMYLGLGPEDRRPGAAEQVSHG